jgi:hypothetical protein
MPENCCPTLSVWQPQPPQPSFIYRQLIFQHSAAICLAWASLIEFIITVTFPSSEMKQGSNHETLICYSNVTAESAATITLRQEFITCFVLKLYCRNALWRNYTAETLCEEE